MVYGEIKAYAKYVLSTFTMANQQPSTVQVRVQRLSDRSRETETRDN